MRAKRHDDDQRRGGRREGEGETILFPKLMIKRLMVNVKL
jgi:hypothetical protein